jgi:hypothetical protein
MSRHITEADKRARALQLKPSRRWSNANSRIVIEPAKGEMAVIDYQRFALLHGVKV